MSKSRRISDRRASIHTEFEQMVSLAEDISQHLVLLEAKKVKAGKYVLTGIVLLLAYIIAGVTNFFVGWILLSIWQSILLSIVVIGVGFFYFISPNMSRATNLVAESEIDRQTLETLEEMIIEHQELAFASMSDTAYLLMEIRLSRIRFDFEASIFKITRIGEEEE